MMAKQFTSMLSWKVVRRWIRQGSLLQRGGHAETDEEISEVPLVPFLGFLRVHTQQDGWHILM